MHGQHSDIDFQMIEVSVRLTAVHGEAHFVTAWINVYPRLEPFNRGVMGVRKAWVQTDYAAQYQQLPLAPATISPDD